MLKWALVYWISTHSSVSHESLFFTEEDCHEHAYATARKIVEGDEMVRWKCYPVWVQDPAPRRDETP